MSGETSEGLPLQKKGGDRKRFSHAKGRGATTFFFRFIKHFLNMGAWSFSHSDEGTLKVSTL